jgi:hypothetical protein
MPLELHVERDERGWRRARVSQDWLALSEFLEADMQGSVPWCDEVLHHIEVVDSRSQERWERSGNACTLKLTEGQAYIEHHYLPDVSCVLALSQFRQAVRLWRDFVQNETQAD